MKKFKKILGVCAVVSFVGLLLCFIADINTGFVESSPGQVRDVTLFFLSVLFISKLGWGIMDFLFTHRTGKCLSACAFSCVSGFLLAIVISSYKWFTEVDLVVISIIVLSFPLVLSLWVLCWDIVKLRSFHEVNLKCDEKEFFWYED